MINLQQSVVSGGLYSQVHQHIISGWPHAHPLQIKKTKKTKRIGASEYNRVDDL